MYEKPVFIYKPKPWLRLLLIYCSDYFYSYEYEFNKKN